MNYLQLNKRRKEESLPPSDFFINMQERGLYKENEIKNQSFEERSFEKVIM